MSKMPERIFAYEETFNGKNRKTGWVQNVPTPGICNPVEYVRADAANAEIDMLRKALGTAGERINAQDAEIERLKARNDLFERAFVELWNVGNLRTHFISERDAQNPDARYVEFSFDDSIMDVETFVRLWDGKEKENGN